MVRKLLAFAALASVSTPALADWYEASSDHFVIYADDSEKDVREFAANLERYHSALELVTGRQVEKPSPSNRVTIFAVGNSGAMRKLTGTRTIGGFYVSRAGASRAFVQDVRNRTGKYADFSTVILLHEYAHHFLISTSRYAMPRWLSEGAAEFFASVSFERDGGIMIGRPAMHRQGDFAYSEDVDIEALFDAELYEKTKGKRYDQFYARSWLLYHYLSFNSERKGQLTEYWRAVRDGDTSLEAARKVFGDLNVLEKELDTYLRQRRMNLYNFGPDLLDYGEISVQRLPEGEAKMMDVRIVSQRGVTREEALELIPDAREIAARYPNDAGVQTALAEAELDAGYTDAAIEAADRAIALDPSRTNAYVQKGYALFRKAGESDDPAAFDAAMKPFTALNRIENDHPLPLIYYYRKFLESGQEPNENARHALERASILAPFDQGLAMNAALMLAGEGKISFARNMMHPLTSNPHGGSLAETAAKYYAALETADEGKPWFPDGGSGWSEQTEDEGGDQPGGEQPGGDQPGDTSGAGPE
ncbi:DUF1570 domain-containing protein [Erythrobacter litoralis]|uniref:DUF1570 domain-containing protein n=1 Tax=Erythrobacter litoralis TaxID=39960 RepID=UPI002435C2CD|nr:DUF1570 domain-containing protein [Erythrobacter litoralis]MDG6078767.1 DUF1570 domain-containing protein [Erythrobacter litoralis]